MNPTRIKFDIKKVFSLSGLKGLFSINSLIELAKSFVKLVVLGYLAYRVMRPIFEEIPNAINYPLFYSLLFLKDQTIHMLLVLMTVITLIAVADFIYTRHKYFKDLRMTKQEVKDERKQMDGDPIIKNKLRRIRLEKSRRRMMAKVPEASVVITNPTHYAVALQYKPKEMAAPVLVAKGPDIIALRIRELAEASDVPIISNPPLARALYDTVDLDEPISPEHYRAVAEIISYVYKLKKQKL
jgi:flagellar biosynthetic protein FlhB